MDQNFSAALSLLGSFSVSSPGEQIAVHRLPLEAPTWAPESSGRTAIVMYQKGGEIAQGARFG
jgi:hypothetical protein